MYLREIRDVAIVAIAACALNCHAGQESSAVKEISFGASSSWRAQRVPKREDDWHHGNVSVGGLGFDVALDVAPRLVQRSYCDACSWLNGARDVHVQNGYVEWGMIRGAQAGKPNSPAIEET